MGGWKPYTVHLFLCHIQGVQEKGEIRKLGRKLKILFLKVIKIAQIREIDNNIFNLRPSLLIPPFFWDNLYIVQI